MRRVVIVQELLPRYRVPFFEQLRQALLNEDVELELLHGAAAGARAQHADEGQLAWAGDVRNRRFGVAGREVVWQSALRAARQADLVVVEHANRYLINTVLIVGARLGVSAPVAFWGHGANLQSKKPDGLLEAVKSITARWPDWWFAYTAGSAARVTGAGYPSERVTVVQNSVQAERPASVDRVNRRCVFVGSLHAHKRIDVLLDAAALVAAAQPGFQLLIVGAGPAVSAIEQRAGREPWLCYLGPLFEADQATVLASAQLLLLPGLVGLAAVDSFVAETPIVTVQQRQHSPEFEYLQNDLNAVVLPEGASVTDYADRVTELLDDRETLARLREGCRSSAVEYSLEHMVERFAAGVLAALRRSYGAETRNCA